MSTSLRLDGVCFAFRDDQPLLDDVSIHLEAGWAAVVGPNGSGKSTLLRLVLGELRPQRGAILRTPARSRAHLCAQRVGRLGAAVEAFGEDWSKGAMRLRGKLCLEPGDLWRWETLSPGERKRWQIGAALAAEPDVLLLDEPSNHLDTEARGLVLDALRDFRGVGLLVSHDRALMDALCDRVLRVSERGVTAWAGGYGAARAQWEAEVAERQAACARARSTARAARRELASARRSQGSASSSLSSASRMKGVRDSDARSSNAKGRARKAEKRSGRAVEVARGRAERAAAVAEAAAAQRADKTLGGRLFLDWEPAPKRHLAVLDAAELRAGDRLIATEVHAELARDARIHLTGPNGAGKTTLIEALMAEARRHLPPERVLYLPQHLEEEATAQRLAALRATPPAERGAILTVVAALGVDPARLLASERPSPGEARKLEIAWGMAHRAWALVLDEPTNHLDLPSIERLEAALGEWPGALLLTSHDARFAAAVTDTRWRFEGGHLVY